MSYILKPDKYHKPLHYNLYLKNKGAETKKD